MTIAKNKSNIDGKRFLKEAFTLEQKLLQVKLDLSTQSIKINRDRPTLFSLYFLI